MNSTSFAQVYGYDGDDWVKDEKDGMARFANDKLKVKILFSENPMTNKESIIANERKLDTAFSVVAMTVQEGTDGFCADQCYRKNDSVTIQHYSSKILREKELEKELYSFPNGIAISDSSQIYVLRMSLLVECNISREYNRKPNESHIEDILNRAKAELAAKNYFTPYGTLFCCVYGCRYYIADGMHRFKAYKRLYNKGKEKDFLVPVQLMWVSNETELRQQFSNINNVELISKVELEAKSSGNDRHTLIAGDAIDLLNERFPGVIEKSNVQMPRIRHAEAMESIARYSMHNPQLTALNIFDELKTLNNSVPMRRYPIRKRDGGPCKGHRSVTSDCHIGKILPSKWFQPSIQDDLRTYNGVRR